MSKYGSTAHIQSWHDSQSTCAWAKIGESGRVGLPWPRLKKHVRFKLPIYFWIESMIYQFIISTHSGVWITMGRHEKMTKCNKTVPTFQFPCTLSGYTTWSFLTCQTSYYCTHLSVHLGCCCVNCITVYLLTILVGSWKLLSNVVA